MVSLQVAVRCHLSWTWNRFLYRFLGVTLFCMGPGDTGFFTGFLGVTLFCLGSREILVSLQVFRVTLFLSVRRYRFLRSDSILCFDRRYWFFYRLLRSDFVLDPEIPSLQAFGCPGDTRFLGVTLFVWVQEIQVSLQVS